MLTYWLFLMLPDEPGEGSVMDAFAANNDRDAWLSAAPWLAAGLDVELWQGGSRVEPELQDQADGQALDEMKKLFISHEAAFDEKLKGIARQKPNSDPDSGTE